MKHYEKKISSEQIYDGMIVSLRRDQVELENGDTALREVIDHLFPSTAMQCRRN